MSYLSIYSEIKVAIYMLLAFEISMEGDRRLKKHPDCSNSKNQDK